jgi:hypothetical protein
MSEAITAPPTPTPTPSPGPSPKSSGPNMDAAFSGFDAMISPDEAAFKATQKPNEKPPEDEKPPVEDKVPPQDQKPPEEKPADEKVALPKPGEQPKVKAATLRGELERSRGEAKEWRQKYEALQAESQKPKADAEKEQLLKAREEWNKERETLQNELKFAKYERSAEYKERYQQPFLNSYQEGQKLMTALSFKEPDKLDEFGAVVEAGKMRKGTEADWDTLMAINDEDSANKFVADHFGHNAARIILQRQKNLELFGAMNRAVEDFRKQAGEREGQMSELMSKQQKEISERWHAANNAAAQKYPELFAPDPADAKGNNLLSYGTRLADLAFGVLDPSEFSKLPESIQAKMVNGKLPPQEMTLLHSAIRNRAAAHDRLVYRLRQKDAELKALQEKLDGFEESEPGKGQERRVEVPGKKKGPAGTFDEIDAEFDRLAAGNG